MSDYINCPFCNEPDFDLVGLKIHIERGWCEKYNDIDTVEKPKERAFSSGWDITDQEP